MAKSKNSSQHNQSKKNHRNGYASLHLPRRMRTTTADDFLSLALYSIKKPKTHRYPSLKGTDPKFRRNHRHALHGTMRALKEVKEGKRDAA
ncbi:Nn.00g051470.m01.CDS01 [Neocucurbitaria sp. VM-36]